MNSAEMNLLQQTKAERARRARRNRGTSLIEIMVVLVILLIGIFLAIRIFPTGFGILRANANRTLATQLAEQQMADLRVDAANLPQGVLSSIVDPATGAITSVTNQDPDSLIPCQVVRDGGGNLMNPCSDETTPFIPGWTTTEIKGKNPYFSDVNKFRFIKGEGVKIPLPTVGAFGTGSVYACKFGPIFMDQRVGNPGNAPTTTDERDFYDTYLAVYGAPLVGINVEANDPNAGSYLRNQQTYLIDYGNTQGTGGSSDGAQIWLPSRDPASRTTPSRTFRVTLSSYSTGGVVSVQADPVTVNDGATGWVALTLKGKTISAIPGSETVTREFDRLTATADWDTTDPYQYKLLSRNILTNQSSDTSGGPVPVYANVGILAFNPSGANYSETSAAGQKPFTAYMDYSVLDWHILRDSREVPSVILDQNKLISVRTTLGFIKKQGSPEADNLIYGGLYGSNSDDIQVFNLSGAGKPDPANSDFFPKLTQGKIVDGNLTPPDQDYYISEDERGGTYRTGTIYINPDSKHVPIGSKLRILYKAEGDWAVAVQKAYTPCRVGTLPGNANLPAPYPVKGARNLWGLGGNLELRLPLADFNKSFVVTIEYTSKTTGQVKRLAPIQMTATKRGDAKGVKGFDFATYDYRWAVISVADYIPLASRSEFVDAASWRVVGAISGISAKTRVIWRDQDSYENRWRVQDTDTYLN